MAIKNPAPEFRKIISCFEYSGCFSDSPEAITVFNCLLESVKPGTKSAMLSHLQRFQFNSNTKSRTPHDQQPEVDDRVCRTAMSTIYIKKAYPTFEGVWQLIIHKAEAWVESVVPYPRIWTELEGIYVANWIGSEVHEDNSLKVDDDLLLEAYNFTNLRSSVPDLIPQHEDRRSLQNAPDHEPTVNRHSKPAPRHKSHRKETSSTRAKRRSNKRPHSPIPAGYRSRSRSRSPHQGMIHGRSAVYLPGGPSDHLYQRPPRRSDFAESSPTTSISVIACDPITLRLPPLTVRGHSVLDQPYRPEPPISAQMDPPWRYSRNFDVSQSHSTTLPTSSAYYSSSHAQAYYPETSSVVQREGSRRDSVMGRPQISESAYQPNSTPARTSYTSHSASRDQEQNSSASQAFQRRESRHERQRMAYH
jgi:hypothetical protein